MSEKRKKKEKDLIFYGFNNICYVFSHTLLNPQHLCYPYKTNADKSLIMHN